MSVRVFVSADVKVCLYRGLLLFISEKVLPIPTFHYSDVGSNYAGPAFTSV